MVTDDSMRPSVENAFEALSAAAPEGWRVELIEAEIHVVPPANGEHEEIVWEVSDQVTERRNEPGLRTYTGVGLFVPDASSPGRSSPTWSSPRREASGTTPSTTTPPP